MGPLASLPVMTEKQKLTGTEQDQLVMAVVVTGRDHKYRHDRTVTVIVTRSK